MPEYIESFPKVNDLDMAFGGYDKEWFRETLGKTEGIERNWTRLASELFFNGGKVPVNKNLDKEYVSSGLRMLRSIIGSFEPRHEEKEIVCGLILKSICDER